MKIKIQLLRKSGFIPESPQLKPITQMPLFRLRKPLGGPLQRRMDNRKGWNRCVADAKKAKGSIWVYSISRASRSSHEFLKLIQEFGKMGVSIVSHSEDLRTDTAAQKMMVGMLSLFSGMEKNISGERTKTALKNLKKEGKKRKFRRDKISGQSGRD